MALSDTNLVVRYYCDEAASGTTPTALEDTSGVGTAFDLAIDYETNKAAFTEVSGNRAWETTDQAYPGPIASKLITGTDKVGLLNGVQKLTVELVINVKVGNTLVGRVFTIDRWGDEGAFMAGHDDAADSIEGYIRFNEALASDFPWAKNERAVWHFVLDTTLATTNDRLKVYKNGTRLTGLSILNITQNETLSIPASSYLCLADRPNQSRGIEAEFFYFALYDEAFTAQRCSDHYDVLTLDDDTPSAGPAGVEILRRRIEGY